MLKKVRGGKLNLIFSKQQLSEEVIQERKVSNIT